MSGDFTPDQKRYLEGFVSGLQAARAARGLAPVGGAPSASGRPHGGPDAPHLAAQDRQVAAGVDYIKLYAGPFRLSRGPSRACIC